MNKKNKILIFVIFLIFSVFLLINRYGFTVDINHERDAKYCNDCEVRHIVEHLMWGFVPPTSSALIILCIFYFRRNGDKIENWELVFTYLLLVILGVCLFFQVEIPRIIQYGNQQGFRALFDIIGFITSIVYVWWFV
jgi:hypothetical protein